MFSPADIEEKRFGTTRLREGYDQDEVDEFLDLVATDYRARDQKIATLQEELKRVLNARVQDENTVETRQIPLVTSASPMGSAEKILVLAQETADKHVADAQAQAADLVRQAGGQGARVVAEAIEKAAKTVADAEARAEVIINEGYAEKAKRLSELEAQHGQVSTALTQLQQTGRKARQALSDAVAAYDQEVPQ